MKAARDYSSQPQKSMLTRNQIFIGIGAALLSLSILLWMGFQQIAVADAVCNGLLCKTLHTTTNDFVHGKFYATGLRKMGDGEVQLLPVGLSKPWQATTSLPAPRAELALVSYNNILYAIGGYDGSQYHTTIYSATTSTVGDITSSWALANNLPAPRAGAAAVIATNPGPILYVIGGGANGNASNTIYYKKIAANGALNGAWSTATLPVDTVYSGAVVRGANLYVIGGGASGSTAIYRIPILDSNGSLGTAVSDMALPESLSAMGAQVWLDPAHDFLYITGGQDYAEASADVYYTSFNADGSLHDNGDPDWLNSSLTNAFTAHGTIQYNGALYVVGGKEGIESRDAITKVLTALIDLDGSLHDWGPQVGKWIVTEPLPVERYFHGSAANSGGELFIAGGYDKNGVPQTGVYHGSTTGAASTYAPNGTYIGEPFDIGANKHMTALKWNAAVEDTSNNKMALALYYRTANDLASLDNTGWTLAGLSAQSANGFTNTLTFASRLDQRYLQYQAVFTTTYINKSPRLNAVELLFEQDPTPTPTRTNTPTATATGLPTNTPTATATGLPTNTPTATATNLPTNTPTATATNLPTNTPTAVPSVLPSATPCTAKPEREVQVSPSNNANLFVRAVPLAWQGDPCKQRSVILIKYDSKTGVKVLKKTNVTDNSFTTPKLTKGRTYVWKVRSCNAQGCGKWSPWRTFKIAKKAQ